MKNNMAIGSIFHNANGQDYYILAYSEAYDKAILFNPKNTFTPFIGASMILENSWGWGHYYKDLDSVMGWFNEDDARFLVEVYEDKDKTHLLHWARFDILEEALRYSEAYEFVKVINDKTNKILFEK